MENLEKIFKQFGFSALPETLRQKEINSKEAIYSWHLLQRGIC